MWSQSTKNKIVLIFCCLFLLPFFSSCKKKSQNNSTHFLASSLFPFEKFLQENLPSPAKLNFLSSSLAARQVEQGAAFQTIILADQTWANFLREKNIVKNNCQKIFSNQLVFVSSEKNFSFTLKNLQQKKIAIADPNTVPLGKFSKQALENLNFFSSLKNNFIFSHSAQKNFFVIEKNFASAGIVYASDAMQSKKIFSKKIIAQKNYAPIFYFICFSKKNSPSTDQKFEKFFTSKKFRAQAKNLGFVVQDQTK